MIKADRYYIDNLLDIMNNGCVDRDPRPVYKDGVKAHTRFVTGVFETYDLASGEFPLTTLRNTAVKTGIREIMWIYQVQDNVLDSARGIGVHWWDEWDIGDGTIGNRYGHTVKKYGMVDTLLDGLARNPFGRRHIMNLYQYDELNSSPGLDPCAYETLWSVRDVCGEMLLDMTLVQRSNDYIMAGYINKIQYVALQMMVAGHCGYKVGKFNHYVNNLHVYDRHYDAVREIWSRVPLDVQPVIELTSMKNFYDYTVDDFTVKGLDGVKKLSTRLEIAV